MKSVKSIYLRLFAALLLSLSLITGCAGGSASSQTADPTSASAGQGVDLSADADNPSGQEAEKDAPSAESTQDARAAQDAFDQFTEDLFREEAAASLLTLHYTVAEPAAYGITGYDRTLGIVSPEDSQESVSEAKELLDELEGMDSRVLREDQRLTYTILSSYLDYLLAGDGLELYDQPLSSSLGIQAQLPLLLAEYAFYTPQDVEDYLSLLSSIGTYYDSILAFERQKSEAGLGMSDGAIDRVIASCSAYLLDAEHSFMAETFDERLEGLEGLSEAEREAYSERNRQAINEAFVPAYQSMIDGLTALKGTGENDQGLSHFPDGKKYYEYLVNLYTGTSYKDIPSLKQAIHGRMAADLMAAGRYLEKDPSLADQASNYQFALTDPEAILEDLASQCQEDFPPIGEYTCHIKDVPKALEGILSPAFYLTVPLDRPEDNSIYINNGSTDAFQQLYTTMAHEGYPGHMYQTLYFNSSNTCNLRKLLSFTSYTEGWATYVEYYAYGLDNGLHPDLAQVLRYNSSFTLALYAAMDIYIHYDGWSMEQIGDYLETIIGISDPEVTAEVYYQIVDNPVNYLEYYVGYMEIMDMREQAEETLGNDFSALEFNRFLLDIGPAPFRVIKPYFNEWLVEQAG